MDINKVLVGISGSIGAVEIQNYLTALRSTWGASVHVIMTESAASMLQSSTVNYFIDGNVFLKSTDSTDQFKIPHIHLTAWADLMVIIPASANIVGKVANGIADDLLSTAAMAAKCPVVFCPNMNEHMLNRPAMQRNLRRLKEDGYLIVEPGGEDAIQLSTGQRVQGAMPSYSQFIPRLEEILRGQGLYV
ncbi:flavoprotein [Tumebacillus algifaecis]|uniref:flavoprotein n=1 Tax=Tumebacillus algifaecis TaxID=1214604 RepID=UPI0012FD8012|nr:flavoprotein [Tumebacillus algifaecis]